MIRCSELVGHLPRLHCRKPHSTVADKYRASKHCRKRIPYRNRPSPRWSGQRPSDNSQ